MIDVVVTTNYSVIADLINNYDFKKWLIEKDGNVSECDLDKPDMIYYLLVFNGEKAGFGAIRKLNDFVSIVDIAIIPKFRGTVARDFVSAAICKYRSESTCKILVTRVDRKNRQSLYFSKWFGFKKYADDDKYIYLRLLLWAAQ